MNSTIGYLRYLSLAFLSLASFILFAQPSADPPNIIFILTDDQRFDALSYTGNLFAQTPEIDKLASEGTYFSHAIVTTPICAASRASILTGLYERAHNYDFSNRFIREGQMSNSYPHLLKKAGYNTAFFGKYGVKYGDLSSQFDCYESYDRNGHFKDQRGYFYKKIGSDTVHLTRYTGHCAMQYLDTISKDGPFCLSLSFSAPHAHDPSEDQYYWQDALNDLFVETTIPAARHASDDDFDRLPERVKEGFNRHRWYWRYDTPEKYQSSVKGYYRMIAGIDLEIGKIRQKLSAEGLADNTIIIIMGDNGYFMGERQLAGKWLMYENSIRVPLIIFDPRQKKTNEVEDMVLNVDIAPTILDFAGLEIPNAWQGKSLRNYVENDKAGFQRDTILIEHLWEFDHIPPSEGVRTNDWKYFRYVNDKRIEELYNLRQDPEELNNLADKQAYDPVLKKLRQACDRLIKEKSGSYNGIPHDLTVESIRNPTREIVIVDSLPEYGWLVPDSLKFQTAYQILVASTQANIDNNIGDVWNSGRVSSKNTQNIAHNGKSLKPGEMYFWKVRLWDEGNRLSGYSKFQKFKTGSTQKMISSANRFMVEEIFPDTIIKSDGSLLVDFGKAAFATLHFTYQADEEDSVVIHLGEKLKEGRIDTDPGGHIRYQRIVVPVNPRRSAYELKIKPDKRNTLPVAIRLPDSFPVLMPFRYVEFENYNGTPFKENYIQRAYFNYWENDQSEFWCDNDTLNQIWDLCKYSIKATTFCGLYVDGDRERIPYEADAYLNQLSHYTTDREFAIARRTIEYFMENPTWPTEWQLHVALMMQADYMYTGNTELIEKYYQDLKHKSLVALIDEEGLVSSENSDSNFMRQLGFKDPDAELRDIVDWPPAGWQNNPDVMGERDGFVFKKYNTVINALCYQNCKILASFASLLEKDDESDLFNLKAAQLRSAINSKLFDFDRAVYRDGIGTDHASLHANMMPLAFGLVPTKYQSQVVDYIRSRGMACSVYGSQYLLEGLFDAKEAKYGFDLLTATHDRSWWNMIRIGSTITLEAWDMKYKPNADWNHAWGAAPANIIPRKLWGINPAVPGASKISIRPQLERLKKSSIQVPFITGNVRADYHKKSGNLVDYSIRLPGNITGKLILNPTEVQYVVVNGQKLYSEFDNLKLLPGANQIQVYLN